LESVLKHGNRTKKEKGLTLVETVIALGIIIIVSTSVVSIMIFSTNSLSKNRITNFFSHETNSFATFYLSYNDSDYYKAVKAMTNTDIDGTNNEKVYYAADYSYSDDSDYSYYVNFAYDGDTLTLTSYDKNDENVFTRSVSR